MKYVYIPESMVPALRAAGLTLTGAEDVKKLTSVDFLAGILSPADVAFYWYANMYNATYIPLPITASLESAVKEVLDPTSAVNATDARWAAIRAKFQDYVLNESAPFVPLEGKRLFVSLLDENTILLTHVDGAVESERDMYDRVIRTLHALIPFEALANFPLFGAYLTATQTALHDESAQTP